MPPRGEAARARHLSLLKSRTHAALCDERLGRLLDDVRPRDDAERATVRLVRRERDRAVKVPARLVKELAETQGHAVEHWKRARAAKRFEDFRPWLARLVALRREQADCIGHAGERYDALLEAYEPGMTVARLQQVLGRLRDGLVPLVAQIAARPAPRTDFLHADAWDVDAQWLVCLDVIRAMGFDFEAGRLDRSVHPFSVGMVPSDVRLTTRLRRDDGASALFSALHEAGHGLYEQGLPAEGTWVGTAASMGLHESQSRLWENFVGRSRAFWTHWFPKLRERFPHALAGVGPEEWWQAVNCVRPSLVRVDADEATYNLHILARFELELDLLRGTLDVADLPAAWNAKYERYLGLRPPDDAVGVMQDIHWAWGELGYFPTYSLGNVYAATLVKAMEKAVPGMWKSVAAGDLLPVRDWLRARIHSRGHLVDSEELVRSVTGSVLDERDLLAYLREKYLSK